MDLNVIFKSLSFGETEMGCLGFWVTRDGVKPVNKKIEAIKYDDTNFSKISTPVYRFCVLLPQYIVKTLPYVITFTKIKSNKLKFKCNKIKQKVFKFIKRIVARNVLLAYPD